MSEEKVRVSGEGVRGAADGPVLPTTAQDAVKISEPQKAGIPSFVYVTSVKCLYPLGVYIGSYLMQCLDLPLLQRHSLQQMDSLHPQLQSVELASQHEPLS